MRGITNIKTMLGFIFLALNAALTLDKNNDGKVTATESITGLLPLGMQISIVSEAAPESVKEFKDLEPEEIDELVEYVQQNIDLPPERDAAERLIKRIVNGLHYNYHFIRDIKEELSGIG